VIAVRAVQEAAAEGFVERQVPVFEEGRQQGALGWCQDRVLGEWLREASATNGARSLR
jgi:hypothetical protein